MAKKSADIAIIGGGLIGLCLAPILGKLRYNVILVDKQKITKENNIQKDLRTVAISFGTKLFLEKYGIWKSISRYAQPINKIHVLNRNLKSKILFDSINNNPMGYIIRHNVLKKKLIR